MRISARITGRVNVENGRITLSRPRGLKSMTASSGKWVKTYDTLEEFIADYKDEITENIDDEDFSFDEKVSEYMDSNGFCLGFDGKVYQKDSAHFDNCVFGGRYINKYMSCVAPYKTVIDEYVDAAAYVLPGYKFYYTDDNKCPFAPDDLVYIIDGHN